MCYINQLDSVRIIKDYGKDPLDIYCKLFDITSEYVDYTHFEQKYYGYFDWKQYFVEHYMESNDIYHDSVDMYNKIMKTLFIEENNYYFYK